MLAVTAPIFANFADQIIDDEELCHFILVGNFLDNQPFIDLLCAKLAIILSNKTVPQVREYFSIKTPTDPAEAQNFKNWEDQVKKENTEAHEIYELDDDDY